MNPILKRTVALCCLFVALSAWAQKPTIMVVPSKVWANDHGYLINEENNGKKRSRIDYEQAFLNQELHQIMAAINNVMNDEAGFQCIDPQAMTESEDEDEAIEEFIDEENDGGNNSSNYGDIISKFRPDIKLEVNWQKTPIGFNYTLQGDIKAIDAYSNKQVGNTLDIQSGTFPRSTALAAALKNCINAGKDEFLRTLGNHFDDLKTNGREMRFTISVKEGSGTNFNTTMSNGETLRTIINEWFDANTVGHQFNESSGSKDKLKFSQVRVSIKDERGRAQQAYAYAEKLAKYLKNTYGLKVHNNSSGLGSGRLVITD